MDFHAKTVEEKDRIFGKIGQAAFRRYQLCKQIEYAEQEIKEIDVGIAENEAVAQELDKVLKLRCLSGGERRRDHARPAEGRNRGWRRFRWWRGNRSIRRG